MMESWCFDFMDKGFVSNEAISQSDFIVRNKNELFGWELKHPFSYEESVLLPSRNSVENPCFSEVGIAELMGRQTPHDSTRNVLKDNASVGVLYSPGLFPSSAISGDDDSSSKFSSSVMDSSSRESSLIDLKLGGFSDKPNSNSTRTTHVLSSAESSTPLKRARVTSLSSETAYCIVHGCHKDLSSEKDYHKRHKVCDVHSKTSVVIVNGVEQRFCQQCSRFHLLGEFDDGKRSCRRRLAGHNLRRRKPHVDFGSRAGRSLYSYTGSNFQGFTSPSTSFICQDILSRGTSQTEKYGTNDWAMPIKIEDGTDNAQKPAFSYVNEQLQPKYILPPCINEKRFPFIDYTDNSGQQQSAFGENVNRYTPEIVSHSLLQLNSPGNEDLTLLDAASTVKGLTGISESRCALSLLSSQSRNFSGNSSGMPGGNPLIVPSNSPHYSVSEVSEELFGVGTQALTSGFQNRYPVLRISSMERNQPSSMLLCSNGDTAHSDFGNEMHHRSKYMNNKDHLACGDGTTIDLLQLSSQLQRVENQK